MSARVRTGLARIAAGDDRAVRLVRGARVGLVAHPASVTDGLVHAHTVLRNAGADVRALFGPEHGYGGEAQDMIGVAGARDPETGAPIHSLYGDTFATLSPSPEQLDGLDAVVIDLQDVGSRYYTFVWTAVLVARACSAAGVRTLVLDRPNPLGGIEIEGNLQAESLRSFVGLRAVPVRHGLTIGEIVRDAARDEGLDGVEVVTMEGWSRAMRWEETGLPWVLPSPNMPTVDTARVYPGGCLLEGTNVSEGRGTTRPFEIFGAPWVDGRALAEVIDAFGDGAIRARPVTFRPMFQKHAGAMCGGVQVHTIAAERARPYRVYLAALAALRTPSPFAWRTAAYEYVDIHPAVDLLTGSAEIRHAIDGGASPADVVALASSRLDAWGDPRSRWMYER